MELLALTVLRLSVPLLILKWPLVGVIASMFLDSSDWHLYPFRTSQDYANYQVWDKLLDSYYLFLAFYTSLFWKDIKARFMSVFLFLFRGVGVILFTLTSDKIFLFLFPNIFENFFLFYLLYKLISKKDQLFLPGEKGILLLTIIAIPKIFQEYLLHKADITATELLGVGDAPSFWLLFSIILSIYLLILWWRVKLQKNLKTSYS